MATSSDMVPDGLNRILRELAVQQGLAYSAYGDALQRFAADRIGWTELFKTSGDIYLKGITQTVWGLVWANASAYAWLLSAAGAKVLNRRTEPDHREAPADKQPRRSRR